MSQVKQKPSHLVTDELTHAHNEFIACNLNLICLWAVSYTHLTLPTNREV